MIKAVKGMEDILPDVIWKWKHVEAQIHRHFHKWGYREIRTPILEHIELFKRGVGEGTDVVSKEMYQLTDRNDQVLVLRPEGTAPVVRALIEHQAMAQKEVEKVYYLAPYFRYEKPQKGRLRQFHQYGIEVIGSPEPLADAEVVTVLWDLYARVFQLKNISCELNSMGCPNCTPAYKEVLRAFLKKNAERYCGDCQRRIDTNPIRVLDCKVPICREVNKNAPKMVDHLCGDCKTHLETVQRYLKNAGVSFNMNPYIVRGFDYYQRTTFEFVSGDLGAQSAAGGGGRYDKLFEDLGWNARMPSIGYAGGVERLLITLEAANYWADRQPKNSLFICHLGEKARESLLSLSRQLTILGVDVHYIFAGKNLKAQLKAADRSGCQFSLLVGERELDTKTAPLKNMKEGGQRDVSLADLSWAKDLVVS